jgi:hypothetical protein
MGAANRAWLFSALHRIARNFIGAELDAYIESIGNAKRDAGAREGIPASDRIVTFGDNSPEQAQALEKIDELVEAVRASNDFPSTPEDKQQVIAELSAGRKLLEAAKVRIAAVRETLQPTLRWIIEKGAGAVIGKLATRLWDLLTSLHIF